MDESLSKELFSNILLFFLIASLIAVVLTSRKTMPLRKRCFTYAEVLTISLVVIFEIIENWARVKAGSILEAGEVSLYQDYYGALINTRIVLTICKYLLYPLIPYFIFMMFEKNKIAIWITSIIYGANALMYLLAPVWPITFRIEYATNSWIPGPLSAIVYYVSIIFSAYLVFSFYWNHRRDKNMIISYIVILVFILAAIVFENLSEWSTYYLMDGVIIIALLYYYLTNNNMYKADVLRFKELELKNKQNELMMSQIKPHFIYNTLNTIYALCDEDPEKAKDTIAKFSKYLRVNLDMKNNLVPFAQEVDHCRNYSDIEMARFRNIHVKFEIGDNDFMLPPLTVQPMIENAIKHGVRSKPNGEILVKSYEKENFHVIEIIDNGVGFDQEKLKKLDHEEAGTYGNLDIEGHAHIGLSNVKERIQTMINGKFEISAVPGEGTTITISIPKV